MTPRAVKPLAIVHTTSLARERVESGSLPSNSRLLPTTPWLHLKKKIAHVQFSRILFYVIYKTYSYKQIYLPSQYFRHDDIQYLANRASQVSISNNILGNLILPYHKTEIFSVTKVKENDV